MVVLAPATGATQGVVDVMERARPTVVILLACKDGRLGQGSGFVYDARGFLLASAHVIDATEVGVRLPNRRPMVAVVAQASQSLDVAVLRVGEEGLPQIPLGAARPRVGRKVLVLGCPVAEVIGFDDLTVTRGIVSRLLVGEGLLQSDGSVTPGNSGGPVVKSRGEAVGILMGGMRGTTGINFAVMIEAARDVARLAVQVPFAPTQSLVMRTPAPAATSPPPGPAPGAEFEPRELRLIGRKGDTAEHAGSHACEPSNQGGPLPGPQRLPVGFRQPVRRAHGRRGHLAPVESARLQASSLGAALVPFHGATCFWPRCAGRGEEDRVGRSRLRCRDWGSRAGEPGQCRATCDPAAAVDVTTGDPDSHPLPHVGGPILPVGGLAAVDSHHRETLTR